jgi:hypothetical protein
LQKLLIEIPIGGIGFGVGVVLMIKIAVKLIKWVLEG